MITQREKLVDLFKRNNNKLTLGQLLNEPSGIGYKCTSRFSDLRKEGYTIICEKAKEPSNNLYIMTPPDDNGQLRFAS